MDDDGRTPRHGDPAEHPADDDRAERRPADDPDDTTPPVDSSPGRGNGPLIAGIVIGLIALLAIAGTVALRAEGPDLPQTFEATDAVPYSIGYPAGWVAQDSGAGVVVISPIENIVQLEPAALEELLTDDPDQVAVLQLFGVVPSEQLANVGEGGALTEDANESVSIDGRDARRITLAGPVFQSTPGEGPDNDGTIVVWVVDLGGGWSTAYFVISTGEAEDAELFDEIADSADFDTPQMEAALAEPPPSPVAAPTTQPAEAPSPTP